MSDRARSLADVDLKALMNSLRAEKVGIQRRLPEDVRQDFGPDVLAAFERSCVNDVGRAMDAALLHGIPGTQEPYKGLIANGTVMQVPTLAALTFAELSAAMARVEVLAKCGASTDTETPSPSAHLVKPSSFPSFGDEDDEDFGATADDAHYWHDKILTFYHEVRKHRILGVTVLLLHREGPGTVGSVTTDKTVAP